MSAEGEVRGHLIRQILDANELSDIESLSCNTRAVVEVGGVVWDDTNADGIRDGGETGIPNVIVELVVITLLPPPLL